VDQYILVFTSIVYEALPFIVLGVIIAGLLEEFVPQQFIAKIIPKNRVLAIALGGFLGLVFPMCECGIIPVMRRLLRKGMPLSLCICYLLAGPVINVVVLTSTYVAFDYTPTKEEGHVFGGPANVMLLRAGFAYLVAFNVGLLVEWLSRKPGIELLSPLVTRGLKKNNPIQVRQAPPVTDIQDLNKNDAIQAGQSSPATDQEKNNNEEEEAAVKKSAMERLNNITSTALNDFVDIMAFLILGAILAAIGRALVQDTDFSSTVKSNPPLAILIMMGLAILFCLCSEADAFVAANFPAVFPPASKLAFLVLGPMMDFKLYMMYTRVFRPRLIWTIIGAVVIQVFVYMLVVHYFGEDIVAFFQKFV
jgi:uncharacterized membrane protein YraQ (UPF0718 family)